MTAVCTCGSTRILVHIPVGGARWRDVIRRNLAENGPDKLRAGGLVTQVTRTSPSRDTSVSFRCGNSLRLRSAIISYITALLQAFI